MSERYRWEYEPTGQTVYVKGDLSKRIADVRGWGWIQKLPNAEAIQDDIGRRIARLPELEDEAAELRARLAEAEEAARVERENAAALWRDNEAQAAALTAEREAHRKAEMRALTLDGESARNYADLLAERAKVAKLEAALRRWDYLLPALAKAEFAAALAPEPQKDAPTRMCGIYDETTGSGSCVNWQPCAVHAPTKATDDAGAE